MDCFCQWWQYVTHHWPQNTLDYRCHVPGGAIGFDYPPKVRRMHAFPRLPSDRVLAILQFAACIESIAKSSAEQLYNRYSLPRAMPGRLFDGTAAHMAERLRAQARLLRDVGFEETLQQTRHKNTTGNVPSLSGFPAPPPCCRSAPRRECMTCPT